MFSADDIPPEYNIDDGVQEGLTANNFLAFGKAILTSNIQLMQDQTNNTGRWNKISDTAKNPGIGVSSGQAGGTPEFSQDPNITFDALAFQYFVAYYKGAFVDRDGGTLTKPAIGTTISDATISNAATVAMEAMFDYAIIHGASKGQNDIDLIKAPIVYDDNNGLATKWETAKGSEPTLAIAIQNALHNNGCNMSIVQNGNTYNLEIVGKPTGGTFAITVTEVSSGTPAVTSGIAFNASASTLQEAIEKLSPDLNGKVKVSGSNGGPYQVIFDNQVKLKAFNASPSDLTGGTVILPVRFVLEPIGKDGSIGITPAKLQIIRFVIDSRARSALVRSGAIAWEMTE